MAADIHISISAEELFNIGGIPITNSILTSLIVSGIIISFALAARAQLTNKGRVSGLQNFAEWVVESLHNLVHSVTGDRKKTKVFFPLVSTFFIFIVLNNLFGLLPGVGSIYLKKQAMEEHASQVISQAHAAEQAQMAEAVSETDNGSTLIPLFRAGTADLNTTIALALISVIVTQVFGVQFLGFKYFKKYINFSNPIMFFVGILELVLEFAKIMSFAFRLFGNIFAGEVLLIVIAFLVPIIAPMPFYGLEIFVGFVQALVFAMLTLVFFNMATIGHDEH